MPTPPARSDLETQLRKCFERYAKDRGSQLRAYRFVHEVSDSMGDATGTYLLAEDDSPMEDWMTDYPVLAGEL